MLRCGAVEGVQQYNTVSPHVYNFNTNPLVVKDSFMCAVQLADVSHLLVATTARDCATVTTAAAAETSDVSLHYSCRISYPDDCALLRFDWFMMFSHVRSN